MSIYYKDESIALHHGDSLEVLPGLDVTVDVLLADPPYFKVKQEEWDNQWDKASEFLGWMGEWLDHAKPLLTAQASVWVFASPAMTSSVERLVGERFRLLNNIRWAKDSGTQNRQKLSQLRSYLSNWEGIIFAEQFGRGYELAGERLRGEIFFPVGSYITAGLGAAGLRAEDAAISLGYSSRLGSLWKTGARLPSKEAYVGLQGLAPEISKPYEALGVEYRALTEAYTVAREDLLHLRRHFKPQEERHLAGDIWNYKPVPARPGKHPCEKPQPLIADMIEASSRPGELILDPFAGSGSTLLAARNAGRKAIGIEKDEAWCEKIAQRLSENTLNLGEAA